MKKVLNIILITLAMTTTACVSDTEHEKAKSQIKRLKEELNFCQNGEPKIIARIEEAKKTKKYKDIKKHLDDLKLYFPESENNNKYSSLMKKAISEIKKENNKLKKQKDLEYIKANANNTGMWTVRHYVDKFGDPTKQGYISTNIPIYGKFSNSATQNSKLRVNLMFNSYKDMTIQLFEYNGKNPVKGYTNLYYSIYVKSDSSKIELPGTKNINYSDRIKLDEESSKTLHNILKKGGKVSFVIKQNNSLSEYQFTLNDTNWYYNAYKKLHNIK